MRTIRLGCLGFFIGAYFSVAYFSSHFALAAPPNFSDLAGSNMESRQSVEILSELYSLISESVREAPLSPRQRILRAQINQLQESYIAQHEADQLDVLRDDSGFPIIFLSLKEYSRKEMAETRKAEKRAFLKSLFPHLDVASMPEQAFEEIYFQVDEEEALRKGVNRKLANLIQNGTGSLATGPDVVNISRRPGSFLPDAPGFEISVGSDYGLGYSVAELLYYSSRFRNIGTAPMEGDAPAYDGQLEFPISKSELQALNLWLDEIEKWNSDFREVVAALVGEQSAEIGQKSVRELLNSSSLTSRGHSALASLPSEQTVLLFNTMGINLTNHPNRGELKQIFEQEYASSGLKSNNGQNKTFLRGTYRSNLGIGQLKLISPKLNKIIKAKQLVEEIFGPGSYFWPVEQTGLDPVETLRQFKITQLNEILTTLAGPRSQFFHTIQSEINSEMTIEAVEAKSLALCERLLNSYSGLNFFQNESRNNTLSDDQIANLYRVGGGIQMQASYQGQIRHKNVSALLETLKGSSLVLGLHAEMPDLPAELDQLKTELVVKLNDYHRLAQSSSYYSRDLVDEAIGYLETLVAKIVYHETTHVTPESVANAMNQLVGVVGTDLVNGCSRGFAGRMSQILAGLVFSTGDELRDALNQAKQMAYQRALQRVLGGSYESSSAVGEINATLAGIIDLASMGGATRSRPQLAGRGLQALQYFAREFSPNSVYHLARIHFSEKFWRLNQEGDNEGMYRLLTDLGFSSDTAELDRKYRVNGKRENSWQYSFFQQDLPSHLVRFLVKDGHLFGARSGGEVSIRSSSTGEIVRVSAPAERLERPSFSHRNEEASVYTLPSPSFDESALPSTSNLPPVRGTGGG